MKDEPHEIAKKSKEEIEIEIEAALLWTLERSAVGRRCGLISQYLEEGTRCHCRKRVIDIIVNLALSETPVTRLQWLFSFVV